jgi:hypothetical protein
MARQQAERMWVLERRTEASRKANSKEVLP